MTVPEEEPLGDVATKLLFENELVRVWQMRLKPGEASAMHRHELPYLMCVVAGTAIDADWPGQPPMTIPVAPGDVCSCRRARPNARSTVRQPSSSKL